MIRFEHGMKTVFDGYDEERIKQYTLIAEKREETIFVTIEGNIGIFTIEASDQSAIVVRTETGRH